MNIATPIRGVKRTCAACEARFYDLGNPAPVCPKCGVAYAAPPSLLPSRPMRRPRAEPKPAAAAEVETPVMDRPDGEVSHAIEETDEDERERDERERAE